MARAMNWRGAAASCFPGLTMTDFSDLLTPDTILANLTVPTKKALFQALGAAAADRHGLDPREVADRLADREKLGSTGFGGGIAIPHAKVAGLDGITGVVAWLAQPIDFDAVDDMPVDLVFMLLSPPDAGAEHLKTLARVSRALRNPDFVAKLRGAGSHDALYALLTVPETRDAA
jgi:PTS system nitrogen regulatory IIA component